MKRRGFLGALLGLLPALPALAKALEAHKPVPAAPMVESEPKPEHVEEVMANADEWANDCSIVTYMTCVPAPVSLDGLIGKRYR
jgi:hypothetical protein